MAKTARKAWVPARFVALPENRSALLAVRRLAHRLTNCRFSPLVLHGPPGSGKSHLANALHERAAERCGVRRVSAADWNTEDLDAHRCDLLIVEDLQHLAERATGDFIAALDNRSARSRATLVTANRGPAALPEIPARLASRLVAGLVIGLEPLSADSRMMLLGNLAKQRKLNISPHVIAWLAERIPGSARQLIAVLSRLQTRTMETGRPLELAEVIELYQGEVCVSVDLETICRHVGTTFGVKMKELRGRDRQPRVLWPRQLSMYLARRLTGFSLAQIGAYFQRDHTTVRHACLKIEDALEDDAELPGLLRRLQAEIE